jgi:hypothetical protein
LIPSNIFEGSFKFAKIMSKMRLLPIASLTATPNLGTRSFCS